MVGVKRAGLMSISVRSWALFLIPALACGAFAGRMPGDAPEYRELQRHLAAGWNTWDTHNVLEHVLLPEGLAIALQIDRGEFASDSSLKGALFGLREPAVTPGPHTLDGRFTELTLDYRGLKVKVQSAISGVDLVLLATPLADNYLQPSQATVAFHAGMLWNREGRVQRVGPSIQAHFPGRALGMWITKEPLRDPETDGTGPYLAARLSGPVGLSTGRPRSLAEVEGIVSQSRAKYEAEVGAHGDEADLFDAIRTALGWNTIYDAQRERVFTPVSRNWNERFGGYVLFCWDTFFASWMAGLEDRDLAYANATEMVKSETPGGFVPNFARADGWDSYDRSQPPVGALAVWALYQKYRDRWFLESLYPQLLAWNRWWAADRDIDGYLAWGSTPNDAPWEKGDPSVGLVQGARFESGLDNSTLYDDVPFDAARHVMKYADVGLNGLYVADCRALARIAGVLGRTADVDEINRRAEKYSKALNSLWDESSGIYRNRNLETGQPDRHLSVTNFYPLLAGAPTPAQARRMVSEHLMNPAEFWGEWVVPATPRNEAAFQEQDYWRGRIWGPMNFLLYLGLLNYDLPGARAALVAKSRNLFLKEWREKGHIHENYNAILGSGDDRPTGSDPFYHWGALLMLMQAIEDGRYGPAEAPRNR